MKRYGQLGKIILGLAGLAALVVAPFQSAEAYDFPRRYASWHHDHVWHRDNVVVVLPWGAVPLRFGDGGYYYCRGRYYRHDPRGYVAIPAPVGAVVPSLPEGHRTIVIDGVTYHEYDGVYYRGGPAGYTVVPIAQATPGAGGTVAVASQTNSASAQNTAIVNVPNKNGSYTPVSLQLGNNGMYIGPQGEVYPNLPTSQQLQAMYGK